MLREFREFIARGNVMDMAVGIIIGAAFTAIVNSMVQDLINPVLGLMTAGIDFTELGLRLSEGEDGAVLAYGNFITSVIEFLVIAWAVFLLVKLVNRIKQATEQEAQAEATEAQPAGPSEKDILIQIRDTLRADGGRGA
jgi:large conductance mechanosensitive channel